MEFKIDEWVIDTITYEVVTVAAIIPEGSNSMIDLYILRRDNGSYYIADSEKLVPYNKYYWEDLA